ncbi:enoyl-CoA hydratase-related protein [Amaricoccus sp. W119]|uniref:enoyl-CoA hydratase-related protein n=1 Tax=Amaricoccus sp. W119 TaxID=3391833 RepID=UPI0039A4B765
MSYETILVAEADGVATITLNRPEVMNGLSSTMRRELTAAIHDVAGRARVIVLTGAGRGFCSGQDLGAASTIEGPELERVLREEYEPMLNAIYDCPIPTIAAVNGAAAGAGANLALAADVVIATRSAVFLQAFSRIGLIPDAGGTYWLPRQVSFARAMGAVLFAEPVSAEQAEAWGMIWQAVPDADFAETVRARARHLANGPTATYRLAKAALRGGLDNRLAEQLALEARLQGQAGATEDFREGVAAFLEKRPARYQGR